MSYIRYFGLQILKNTDKLERNILLNVAQSVL